MNGDIGIGKIIQEGTERGQDAIHIAVAPVVAAEELEPGQYVGLTNEGKATLPNRARSGASIGIVDPFLLETVFPGQKFYLFLYPGTITSLRHEWTHPAFEKLQPPLKEQPSSDKAASDAWLRAYAHRFYSAGYFDNNEEVAYQMLLRDLKEGVVCYRGTDMHDRSELADAALLREHAQVVLGQPIDFDKFEYFSCTC